MLVRLWRPTGKGPEIKGQKKGEKTTTVQGYIGLQQFMETPQTETVIH